MNDPVHKDKTHQLPAAAQAIVDRHMEELMRELETADFQAVGVVMGVLCEGKTSVSWCAKDDMVKDGKPIPVEAIVREISVEIERVASE
jgi:low affinity Fe/Cu permease